MESVATKKASSVMPLFEVMGFVIVVQVSLKVLARFFTVKFRRRTERCRLKGERLSFERRTFVVQTTCRSKDKRLSFKRQTKGGKSLSFDKRGTH